jgi:hypothetical protein
MPDICSRYKAMESGAAAASIDINAVMGNAVVGQIDLWQFDE